MTPRPIEDDDDLVYFTGKVTEGARLIVGGEEFIRRNGHWEKLEEEYDFDQRAGVDDSGE